MKTCVPKDCQSLNLNEIFFLKYNPLEYFILYPLESFSIKRKQLKKSNEKF